MKDDSKKPLNIVPALLGMASVMLLAAAAYYYLYYKLPPEQVSVSVKYSPAACSMETPVYMQITNDSLRDIMSTSFILLVKKQNDGDSFIQLLKKNYSSDRLIRAGETYGGCWAYPKLITSHYVAEQLIYEIEGKQILFSD